MNAAGYCSTYINNYFVWNSNGLNSCDSSSSAFIDGIFRTDTSAGSSHRGGQTLASLEGTAAGFEAAKEKLKANMQRAKEKRSTKVKRPCSMQAWTRSLGRGTRL